MGGTSGMAVQRCRCSGRVGGARGVVGQGGVGGRRGVAGQGGVCGIRVVAVHGVGGCR